ncbi:MAG TPA: ABC transporter permease [Terracidiphilus sp.]|jgi:putative ABC transport system permease protein|nr:ABC transporter permease [Terracidiphilus sp.]
MKWWRLRKRDEDLRRELESDLELEREEQRERGLSMEDARFAAQRAFGNATVIREQTRAVWSWNGAETLLRDLRISVRTLLRSPGFSIMAVLVMALCIGATTSLFTVMRSVMLRPLPFKDPDKLVMLYEHFRDPAMNAQGFNYNSVAPGDYYDWRAQTHGFEDMAVWRWWQFNLTGEHGELPELVNARGGSWNLFPLLGVKAAIGRTFTANEDRPDGTSVLLTWGLFERRFGGSASIVGRQIHLDGKPYTVVGVLPKWFTYPDAKVQLWVPYASGMPPAFLGYHDHHSSSVVARLRPDVSLASALSQVEAVQYRLHMKYLNNPVAEDVAPRTLIQDLAKDVKKPLIILLCAVACMLLIGCLNVANLMVARSAARQKEIAIRSALGAQRAALIRAQLMESLLVSIAGGVAGVLFSLAATQWLVSTWKGLPSAQSIHVDGVVVMFACGLVFAAALLAGLLPAISSTGKGAIAALQASARSGAGSKARTTLRKTLLTVEIAATVVLLISAGLLLKSFWKLRTTDVGCVTDNVLTMGYNLPEGKYDTPDKANAFNEALLEKVRSMPGVRAAGLGFLIPGAGPMGDDDFTIPEHPPIAPGTPLPVALYGTADPGFFSALQIPLVAGRFFTSADRAGRPATVIVSQRLAQQYFPGENPLGKHLHIWALGDAHYEIVGVVADTLYQVGKPAEATVYLPVLRGDHGGMTLVVRTASDPLAFSVPVQKLIAGLDPELPVRDVLTMQQVIERSLGNASLSASLVLAFAVLSLILASVGLYGVLSYLMTQRTGEIGIRMALGAQREQVVRMMLGDGLRPVLYGLVLGLAVSVEAVHLIQSMLYSTRLLDPAVYAGVAVTLFAMAALASLIPAWKASRIDPMQALRME